MPLFRWIHRQRLQLARLHTVLVLYVALLLTSIACSVGYGASAGAQLNNQPGLFCSDVSTRLSSVSSDMPLLPSAWFISSDCAIATSFSSVLLLAWLGLLCAWAGRSVVERATIKLVVQSKHWLSLAQARAPPAFFLQN